MYCLLHCWTVLRAICVLAQYSCFQCGCFLCGCFLCCFFLCSCFLSGCFWCTLKKMKLAYYKIIALQHSYKQQRTGYTSYNKLALLKVENMKAKIFSSSHLISLLTKNHNQKWLLFGKMHERLVIVVSKTRTLIRIWINFRVNYDV